MDLRKIKKLIELVEDSTLTELEIREGEESVRLSRAASAAPIMATLPAALNDVSVGQALAGATGSEDDADIDPRLHPITSPVVGTYYASADPDTPPFVEIRQHRQGWRYALYYRGHENI